MADTKDPVHFKLDDLPWTDYSAWYPEDMMKSMRGRRVIGPSGHIQSDKTVFGYVEIDPGATYPPHRHEAAEVYYVISGRAECVFGDEEFVAEAGSIMRTAPNMLHSMRTLGEEPFKAIAYWYSEADGAAKVPGDLELVDDD